jgi:hypothetical protein
MRTMSVEDDLELRPSRIFLLSNPIYCFQSYLWTPLNRYPTTSHLQWDLSTVLAYLLLTSRRLSSSRAMQSTLIASSPQPLDLLVSPSLRIILLRRIQQFKQSDVVGGLYHSRNNRMCRNRRKSALCCCRTPNLTISTIADSEIS